MGKILETLGIVVKFNDKRFDRLMLTVTTVPATDTSDAVLKSCAGLMWVSTCKPSIQKWCVYVCVYVCVSLFCVRVRVCVIVFAKFCMIAPFQCTSCNSSLSFTIANACFSVVGPFLYRPRRSLSGRLIRQKETV